MGSTFMSPGQATFGSPVFFPPDDFAAISRISDLIIPPTDTPGAVQARVPSYIDLVVSANPEHQSTYRNGLEWLKQTSQERHGKPFTALTEQEQIALLTPLSDAVDAGHANRLARSSFKQSKNMTADGYYTSKIGMSTELGFKGGAMLPEFPSCEVPEH